MQVKVLHRDWTYVVEFLLQLENKQQIKQNNVETQHKCMCSCIHNILVSVVCVTYSSLHVCTTFLQVFVKIWMQWSIAFSCMVIYE